jgi:hypothetical protein
MLGIAGAAAPAANASGWGRPFRLAPPYTTDLTPATVAVGSAGQAAAAFSAQDEETPAVSNPYVAMRSAGGRVAPPQAVPRAQLVLDLAFRGRALELLTGNSETGKSCCSTVQASSLASGGSGRPQTLVSKLAGTTTGSLTQLPSGSLLAMIATDRGVWVAQARSGGRFGPARRLTSVSAMPWTVAATADARGRTVVAWTSTSGQQGEIAPNQIVAAAGSERSAPAGSRTVFTAASGRAIDELALAPAASAITGGWVESWFDRRGAYHSQVVVSDLAAGSRGRVFSVPGQTPSALVIAGNGRGDELAAWKSCVSSGTCTVTVSVRRAGKPFGPARRLGSIDPGQSPAAAVAPDGDGLVGWIASGHVYAAERRPGAVGLRATRIVSSTAYASGLTLAFGPSRTALAAWIQGTLAPDVVGAVFRG